jgi:hypothetical protein
MSSLVIEHERLLLFDVAVDVRCVDGASLLTLEFREELGAVLLRDVLLRRL